MGNDRYDQLVQEFLGKKRIAIWGMEDSGLDLGKLVAGKLRKRGIKIDMSMFAPEQPEKAS